MDLTTYALLKQDVTALKTDIEEIKNSASEQPTNYVTLSDLEQYATKEDLENLDIEQTDWNEEDPTKAGYLKNKPFGLMGEIEVPLDVNIPDQNSSESYNFEASLGITMVMLQINGTIIPSYDNLKGLCITLSNGEKRLLPYFDPNAENAGFASTQDYKLDLMSLEQIAPTLPDDFILYAESYGIFAFVIFKTKTPIKITAFSAIYNDIKTIDHGYLAFGYPYINYTTVQESIIIPKEGYKRNRNINGSEKQITYYSSSFSGTIKSAISNLDNNIALQSKATIHFYYNDIDIVQQLINNNTITSINNSDELTYDKYKKLEVNLFGNPLLAEEEINDANFDPENNFLDKYYWDIKGEYSYGYVYDCPENITIKMVIKNAPLFYPIHTNLLPTEKSAIRTITFTSHAETNNKNTKNVKYYPLSAIEKDGFLSKFTNGIITSAENAQTFSLQGESSLLIKPSTIINFENIQLYDDEKLAIPSSGWTQCEDTATGKYYYINKGLYNDMIVDMQLARENFSPYIYDTLVIYLPDKIPSFDPIADEGKTLKIINGEMTWVADNP